MNIPIKTLNSGFSIPVYGLGTWMIGGKREADTTRDKEEIATLRNAIERGVRHIDTAESYAGGHSEELVGQAIKGYDRSSLFIATKVSGIHQRHDDLIKSAHASLTRLGTDYIDLYMLHEFPSPGIAISEAMAALDGLVDKGLVRHIGVSNLSPRRFAEAQKYAKHKIVYNQLHYNVQFREAEASGALAYCQANDVILSAWRPLQKNAIPETGLIDDLARKYHKTPAQVMLNWLISQHNVVTIAKTSTIEHLEENLGALGWELDSADIEAIRGNFPERQEVSDTYPLNYPGDVPYE